MPGGLTAVDWAILFLYALGTVILGYTYGRRQKTTREYFTGSGRMNPTLIGFSIAAIATSGPGAGPPVGSSPASRTRC